MHNDYEVMTAVRAKYKECIDKASEKTFPVPEIPIYFDLTGVCAGMYCWGKSKGTYFRVNLDIARNQLEDYLARTVPHEVSHHIVRIHFPEHAKSHGWQWQRIMHIVFGLEPSRCHSYDIKDIIVKKKPHKYTCACLAEPNHYLSNIRHKRALETKQTYICLRCRCTLVYQGTNI